MANAMTTTSTGPAVPQLGLPFLSVRPLVMNGVDAARSATRAHPQLATQTRHPADSAPVVRLLKPQAVNLVLAARAGMKFAVGRGQLRHQTTCPAPAVDLQHQRNARRLIAQLAFPKGRPIAPRTRPSLVLLLPLAIPA